MKTVPILLSFFFFSVLGMAQTGQQTKVYQTYEAFENSSPTNTTAYRVEQRTQGDIVMMGGIANYKFGKVKPKSLKNELIKEVWGIEQDGEAYINAYPYSMRKGYNKIQSDGPYRYFLGEPAYALQPQIELGFIEPGDRVLAVCCQTGYVLYPDGKVELLTPDLLLELIASAPDLKTKAANLQQEDTLEMFKVLEEYNGKQ